MKAKEIIGEGVLSAGGKLLQKLGTKMLDKGAAQAAAKAADKPSTLGQAAKAITYPIRNPVKSSAVAAGGLGAKHYLTDPDKPSVGTAVGRGIKDVGGFWSDVYSGVTGGDTPADTARKAVDALPDPGPEQEHEQDFGDPDDVDYVGKIRQRSAERFQDWPGQQNESIKKKFAVEQKNKEKEDPLTALQRGIYGQESGYGKAQTNRPNYAGAMGPMQIMPNTFSWMKKSKIIPQDYDIKNPEHNRAAGNALIAHYYQKYNGDAAKVAAAYYAGPGAINKDGTINTHWRDRKNPKAPTVGEYINQTLAKANLPSTGTGTMLATIPSGSAAKPSKPSSPPEPVTPAKILKPSYVPSGPTFDEILAQTDKELAQRRAAAKRIPTDAVEPVPQQSQKQPPAVQQTVPADAKDVEWKNKNWTGKTSGGNPAAGGAVTPATTEPFSKSPQSSTDKEAWDKFIDTVTVGRVPAADKEKIQVPESINKTTDLEIILKLAGKK